MLELRNIKKVYDTGSTKVDALKGIDLRFRKSEFVSILGPSGCGKTTLLNIVGGLDGYTDGDLIINGTSTKEYKDRDWDSYRNHSVGFVFQSYNLIPHQSVLQNVELALTLSGVSKRERKARAAKALTEVGLGDQINKKPAELSGGQMQRVAIARALVNNPDIILADEPTGALDTETSVQVMEILKKISNDRLIVMVTHNPELAEKYSTRIIKMLDGKLVGDTNPLTQAEVTLENSRIDVLKASKKEAKKEKKPSMSFRTSFMLSLKNLFSKKGRTTLTSFAGSIGIIGIALILSVSQGTNAYIDYIQETTLSAYPLTLESQTIDMTAMIESLTSSKASHEHKTDAIYKDPVIADLVNALSKLEANQNDLAAFKKYIENDLKSDNSKFKEAISGVQYTYNIAPVIYTKNIDGDIVKSDTNELMIEMFADFMMKIGATDSSEGSSESSGSMSLYSSMMMSSSMWQELLPGLENGAPINDLLKEQYEVIYGSWPNSKEEVVLVVNENNELDDLTLYALGLLSKEEIDAIIDAASTGQELEEKNHRWTYEEICGLTFKTILPYDCYKEVNGIFVDMSQDEYMLKALYESAFELKVVGIIRPDEDAEISMLRGAIGYTHMLTEHIIEEAANSPVVQAQLASPTVDVLTGLPFESNTGVLTSEEKEVKFREYINSLDTKEKAEAYIKIQALKVQIQTLDTEVNKILSQMQNKEVLIQQISSMLGEQMGLDSAEMAKYFEGLTLDELKEMLRPALEEQIKASIDTSIREQFESIPVEDISSMLVSEIQTVGTDDCALYYDNVTVFSNSTYEKNLITIGCVDIDTPATINIYATSFENKDLITAAIADYNDSVDESKKISYTDYLGIMMSSITTIINAITYVLIAFVSISLVVSSIMIGVITLISVQERTKEIGILRAIGASKKDVSSMFTAETMIIGLSSGLLGVIVTYLLCIPINIILYAVTGLANLKAVLPLPAATMLVGISIALTLVSGLIPSRSAAKKDPVVALRTE